MKLRIKRIFHGMVYTVGRLSVDGVYFCDTLEPAWRDFGPGRPGKKVKGQTAIPEGRYTVVVSYSPRFGRWLPLLADVFGFDGVRIHAGNTPQDTEGYILVGENKRVGMVLNSRVTLAKLMATLRKAEERNETIQLEIV